ncbi:acyltransferase family protein [Duncaniella muris]|uniref:acyltransferase family protein n=1 Tax=Duncaniella muris TaxID=2094150 RepID=UPI001C3C48B1
MSACAVPIFFFFSGYLFFLKTQAFNKDLWLKKLKSRFKSLFIPYMFWSLLGVIVYGLLAYLPYTKNIFGNGNFDFSWAYIGEQITGLKLVDGEHIYQMGYHLWFLRDLLLMAIISPVFYMLFKNNRIWPVYVLIGIWLLNPLFNFIAKISIGSTSFIYFGLGAYFGINKIDFLCRFKKISTVINLIYPCLIIIDWAIICGIIPSWNFKPFSNIIHGAMILCALPFWCNITTFLVKKNLVRDVSWLASASFFVYLIHIPFILPQVKKILYHIANPQTQEMLVSLYFATVLLSIAISLLIYKTIKHLFPNFTKIITGGR